MGVQLGALAEKYGGSASIDRLHADALRLEIKKVVFSSWNRRAELFGGPIDELPCYPNADIRVSDHLLDNTPRDCPRGVHCCLRERVVSRREELSRIREAIPSDGRQETSRRKRVLRQLEKHSTSQMGASECRAFGDAYFVMFCPEGHTIITTNTRDIDPMARAVGVSVESP